MTQNNERSEFMSRRSENAVGETLLSLTQSVYIDPLGTTVKLFFPDTEQAAAWAASFFGHGMTDKTWEEMEQNGFYRVLNVSKYNLEIALAHILENLAPEPLAGIGGRKYRKIVAAKLPSAEEQWQTFKDRAQKLVAEFARLGQRMEAKQEIYAGEKFEDWSDKE